MREKLTELLRWSEKYARTDMVYLVKGGFWLTLSKIIGVGASLLTSVAFANLLPQETYGVYRYVLSILTLLVIPTLAGIDTALTRSVAKGNDSTFFLALKTKVKWGTLGSIASIILAAYYFLNANTILGNAFLLAAVFIPVMDPANLFLAYLSGKKTFKSQMYYQAVIRLVSSLLIIGVVFITNNIIALLFVYFASYTLLRVIFLFITKQKVDRNTETDKTTITYGKHLTFMKTLGLFSITLDKILVFHFTGGTALAGYYLALLPMKQIQNIFGSLNVLALPNFSLRGAKNIKSTLPRKLIKLYIIIIPTVLIYWLLAQPFFTLIYPQYTDFVFISQIFMIQLFFFPTTLMNTAITASGDKKKLYIQSVLIPILRITFIVILVPMYGVTGAVASMLSTAFVSASLTTYFFAKLR